MRALTPRPVLLRLGCLLGLVMGTAAVLPSCTHMGLGPHVNLIETNYGAADMLAQQSKGLFKPGTPVRVDVLHNTYGPRTVARRQPGNPDRIEVSPLSDGPGGREDERQPVVPQEPQSVTSAPFGKVVIEQIAGRMVDLGFNVVGGSGTAGHGQAVLTGQYARANGRVLVNLRLLDGGTGRILGAYDYSVPISSEVSDLLESRENSGLFD